MINTIKNPRKKRRLWTDACTVQLRELAAQGLYQNEIAKIMGRRPGTIRQKAELYGIDVRRRGIKRHGWSPEMDAYLDQHYATNNTAELAAVLGVSTSAVFNRAYERGLSKSEEYLNSTAGGRIQPGSGIGKSTRFRPGHKTWNKGKKGVTGLHPNSVKHHFKPGPLSGRARHNYCPVGTEKVRPSSGLLMRKVTDDVSVPAQSRWKPVHTLLWVKHHGAVPPGHICVFKQGMHTTISEEITLDRIEVISHAENMRRNTIHKYPEEIKDLIRVTGKLRRTIRSRERELEKHREEHVN